MTKALSLIRLLRGSSEPSFIKVSTLPWAYPTQSLQVVMVEHTCSVVPDSVTPWAPLSMEFSRQEY